MHNFCLMLHGKKKNSRFLSHVLHGKKKNARFLSHVLHGKKKTAQFLSRDSWQQKRKE